MCVALNIHLHKEKFKSDDYSYTHWWIDPSNLFSKTSSWVVLFQVLLDVNCCALIYFVSILDIHIIPGYSKRVQGWALSGHCLYGDESGVPEFWNLRITSTTTPAVFFFDSDSSQMLFNPYTCWGINTGTIPCSFRVISLCFYRNEITEDSCNIFDLSIEL